MDLNQIQSNPSINLILSEMLPIHPFMTFTSTHLCKQIIFILLIDWYLLGPASDALFMFFNTFGSAMRVFDERLNENGLIFFVRVG
jgi:hypothetical protein